MARLTFLTTHLCSQKRGRAVNREALLQQRPTTGQQQVLGAAAQVRVTPGGLLLAISRRIC